VKKQALGDKLAQLRSNPDHDHLRQALKDRNNYVVARTAEIISDLHLDELIPDLLGAFDRFFRDSARSDPHCLAKTAIAKALRSLGHHGAPAFVRGIQHVQLEPAWGGRADTAAELRGACALALTDCVMEGGDLEILTYLADALADPDKTVRIDAAMAIEQLNRPEGAILLRLKALIGDPDPDVMGQCFSSMLSLGPLGVVAFISRFLRSSTEDIQLEAASALAQCRDPEAIGVLREFWREPLLATDLRQALLINLGASPLHEAAEFLFEVVASEPIALAIAALTALATSRFQTELRPRLADAVACRDSTQLRAAYEEKFAKESANS
jgi:HEAT repeat protein